MLLLLMMLLMSLLAVTSGKDWSGTGGAGKMPPFNTFRDPATDEAVNFVNNDYSTVVRPDSLTYDRCKITHRCNRAFGHYDVEAAHYNFTSAVFPAGVEEPGKKPHDNTISALHGGSQQSNPV